MTYIPPNPNGQATSANSAPVVIASNQSSIPVTNIGTSLPISNATNAVGVALVDGSGNQVSSFGGGTEYVEDVTTSPANGKAMFGRYVASPTGAVSDGAMMMPLLDPYGHLIVEPVNAATDILANAYATDNSSTPTGGIIIQGDNSGTARDMKVETDGTVFIKTDGTPVPVDNLSSQHTEGDAPALAHGYAALGRYEASPPGTLIDGQLSAPLMDNYGQLKVVPVGTVTTDGSGHTQPVSQSGTWTVGSNSATGSAIPANAFSIGGYDSTNLRAISVSTTGIIDTGLAPARTLLNTYSVHLTANTTTTPTASTAYISSITISNEVGGTTSTVTIQDKQGTPLKLVNGVATTALTTAPTVINFQTPVKMVSGIDIITAGAVAATVDVWINYYQ